MARLTWKDGQWIDKDTGKPSPNKNKFDFSKPWTGNLVSDYEGYDCPVTGKWIEGRKAHEDNLKATGCRVLEPGEKEDNKKWGEKHKYDAIDAAVDKCVDEVAKDFL